MSLPLALATTLESLPAQPHLHADPMLRQRHFPAIDQFSGRRLRVGLVWAGNPALAADARRSVPTELLRPLLDVPGVAFVGLQKDCAMPLDGAALLDVMPECADFADTAGVIANLDLVIAVDTAVAHLAAGMGKPVWLLDRHAPCWRWMLGREDSPWYPSLRIFRQAVPGGWEGVIRRVARALEEKAALHVA